METTRNTETFTITITEIEPDYDNPTDFEISFETTLTRAYLESIFDADTVADILDDDLNDDDINDDISYELNVAHRHSNGLYASFLHDRSGDSFDTYEHAIDTFGQPVIDFIADACRLLNIPFYPSAD